MNLIRIKFENLYNENNKICLQTIKDILNLNNEANMKLDLYYICKNIKQKYDIKYVKNNYIKYFT